MTLWAILKRVAEGAARARLRPAALALLLAATVGAGKLDAQAGRQKTDPKAASAIESVCSRIWGSSQL